MRPSDTAGSISPSEPSQAVSLLERTLWVIAASFFSTGGGHAHRSSTATHSLTFFQAMVTGPNLPPAECLHYHPVKTRLRRKT